MGIFVHLFIKLQWTWLGFLVDSRLFWWIKDGADRTQAEIKNRLIRNPAGRSKLGGGIHDIDTSCADLRGSPKYVERHSGRCDPNNWKRICHSRIRVNSLANVELCGAKREPVLVSPWYRRERYDSFLFSFFTRGCRGWARRCFLTCFRWRCSAAVVGRARCRNRARFCWYEAICRDSAVTKAYSTWWSSPRCHRRLRIASLERASEPATDILRTYGHLQFAN